MSIVVTLDTVERTLLDVPRYTIDQQKRFIRNAVIQGIDVASSPKYEAMFLAQTAIVSAEAASSVTTGHSDLILQRILLEPLGDTTARAQLIYETALGPGGSAVSTWVITDDGNTTTRQTNYLPGTRQKISTAWEAPASEPIAEIPEDYVTMGFLAPLRTIRLDALMSSRPQDPQTILRRANSANWPSTDTYPLAKGYWLMTRFASRLAQYNGYYAVSAEATSKVDEDWSEAGTLIDSRTGKYVQVGATISDGDDIIADLFSSAYAYGITYGSDSGEPGRNTGVVRVGPYQTTNFVTVFGF